MSVQTAYTITNPASRGRCHSCRYLIASLTATTIKAKFIIILSAVVAVILVVIDSQIRSRSKASAQAAPLKLPLLRLLESFRPIARDSR